MLCLTALTSPDVTDGTGQNPLLTPFNTTVTSILSFVNGQNTVLEPSLFALSGVLLGEDWHPGKTPPPPPPQPFPVFSFSVGELVAMGNPTLSSALS